MYQRHRSKTLPVPENTLITVIDEHGLLVMGLAKTFNWDATNDYSGNAVYAYAVGNIAFNASTVVH